MKRFPQFPKGTVITAPDGWKGVVQMQRGRTVVALQVGEVPNDDLRGYKTFRADDLQSAALIRAAAIARRREIEASWELAEPA
jgi:hypothetical protein